MHLDRNLYQPGDTTRFQAYIRDSRTGIFGTESSTLYALLINRDHITIDSARFRIIYHTVPGWLVIPEKCTPGDFSILAFTSSDMNFSPKYAFSAPVKIENFISSKNESEQKVKNQDILRKQELPLEPKIDLTFLPEGGTFICGIKQRIAFNAITSNGKGFEVTGEIANQKGVRIIDFRSASYGPGVVEFTPIPGETYFATINGEEFKGLKWPLPVPEKAGVALEVNNTGNGLIDIILKGREIKGSSYFLTVVMNNVLVYSEELKIDTLYRKKLLTDKLPSGTAYISIYNHDLNPVAERLIFLNNYKKMNIKIEVSSSSYLRGEETEITISTSDENGNKISSVLSVAVIDSTFGYYDAIPPSQIESSYLYDREFYENLPLQIKSKGLINFDYKSLDILLMSFGWRKYTTIEVTESPVKEIVNYDYLKICNPELPLNGRSYINLISDASPDVISLKVNNNGEAILDLDSLYPYVKQIMIMPDNITSKNINPVRIAFPENKDFTDRAKQLANFPANLTYESLLTNEKQPGNNIDDNLKTETRAINNPLDADKSKEYFDNHTTTYQSTGAITLYSKDFDHTSTLDDILYRSNPYKLTTTSMFVGSVGKQIFLRNAPLSISGHGSAENGNEPQPFQPALIVLDNNPIGTTYESIADMPTSRIASVTFLRGTQGFTMYGTKAIGGVVFITTKSGKENTMNELSQVNKVKRNDNLFKQVRLFRTETKFYIPTKEEVALEPEYQFRPTMLWKDHVVIDDSGKITIKYPNNLARGSAIVIVNGFSFTNLIGSGTYLYKIQ